MLSDTMNKALNGQKQGSFPDSYLIPRDRKFILDQLQLMPVAWLNELYQGAEMADNRELNRLIEEIRTQNPDLANLLTNLIKEFRVDTIFDLTEQVLNSRND